MGEYHITQFNFLVAPLLVENFEFLNLIEVLTDLLLLVILNDRTMLKIERQQLTQIGIIGRAN